MVSCSARYPGELLSSTKSENRIFAVLSLGKRRLHGVLCSRPSPHFQLGVLETKCSLAGLLTAVSGFPSSGPFLLGVSTSTVLYLDAYLIGPVFRGICLTSCSSLPKRHHTLCERSSDVTMYVGALQRPHAPGLMCGPMHFAGSAYLACTTPVANWSKNVYLDSRRVAIVSARLPAAVS